MTYKVLIGKKIHSITSIYQTVGVKQERSFPYFKMLVSNKKKHGLFFNLKCAWFNKVQNFLILNFLYQAKKMISLFQVVNLECFYFSNHSYQVKIVIFFFISNSLSLKR